MLQPNSPGAVFLFRLSERSRQSARDTAVSELPLVLWYSHLVLRVEPGPLAWQGAALLAELSWPFFASLPPTLPLCPSPDHNASLGPQHIVGVGETFQGAWQRRQELGKPGLPSRGRRSPPRAPLSSGEQRGCLCWGSTAVLLSTCAHRLLCTYVRSRVSSCAPHVCIRCVCVSVGARRGSAPPGPRPQAWRPQVPGGGAQA